MFDSLESRRLFSVNVEHGALVVRGSTEAQLVTAAWRQDAADAWTVQVNDGAETQELAWSPDASWQAVSIYGGNGGDLLKAAADVPGFTNSTTPPVPIRLNGGAGCDTIDGSDNGDTIIGGSAADLIHGYGGNDSLNGESGADTILGGDGNDTAFGGVGRDSMLGEAGDDVLDGGRGADVIYGGSGMDTLFAGTLHSPAFHYGANRDGKIDTVLGGTPGDVLSDAGDRRYM